VNAALEELCATGAALRDAVQRVIIGQEQVVEEALIALLCGGHVLIEGVPGLGKTLLVESLAKAINGQFHRVQFTPDLLPADITGSMIYDPGESRFKFRRGPVFTNLLLADEINRAPAKTQAALLEVMQERQVTIEGKTLPLAAPFMVLATQNPFEQEGTYHLPEAQLDRFLLNSRIDYPQEAQEKALLSRLLGFEVPLANNTAAITPLLDATTLPTLQKTLLEVQVDERIIDYALALVRKTRAPNAARAARKEGLHDLISAARRIAPRVEPDVETHAHMGKERVTGRGCAQKEREGKRHIRFSTRSHIRHGNSYAKKEQSRAEIALHDEHQDGDTPDQ